MNLANLEITALAMQFNRLIKDLEKLIKRFEALGDPYTVRTLNTVLGTLLTGNVIYMQRLSAHTALFAKQMLEELTDKKGQLH